LTIDYNAIAAYAALATAIVAILTIWYEYRRSRFALGVELIMKLDDRFNSKEMQKKRQIAVESLPNKGNPSTSEILDFFELIGLLTRRGAIDEEIVWNTFSYSIYYYYYLAREYVKEVRKSDPHMWENLDYLHRRLDTVNKRRYKDSDLLPSEADLKQFLEEEKGLLVN